MYFSLPIPFFIKKTSNCNDIRIQNHLEYVELKSEISEVSAHLNYFPAN